MYNRNNVMWRVLFGLVMLGVVEDGVGMYKFDAAHVKSWSEEGKKAGAFTRDVFGKAEQAVMKMLLVVAAKIAGTPSQEDFLTGYASAWSNKDTGKSRKTDARAVFEAYARRETDDADSDLFEYSRTVGYQKEADGVTFSRDAQKQLIPINEAKTGREWLEQYEGDFKGFLALAREIRNAGAGRQSQGTGADHRSRKKVTDKQFTAIMEALPVASANQAHAVIVEAGNQLAKLPGFEVVMLNEIELLCNKLKTSKQPIFQEAAAKMFDILNDLRDEVRKAGEMQRHAAANLAGANASGDLHVPPVAQPQKQAA